MAPHNKKRNMSNFFTKKIEQYGEDFLNVINAREMQNQTKNIFRELAQGRVDIKKFGHYFLNPQFLNVCISAAVVEFDFHNISFNGVNFMYNSILQSGQVPDVRITTVLDSHKRSTEAYGIIINTLSMVQSTSDPNHLYALVNNLSSYRNNL